MVLGETLCSLENPAECEDHQLLPVGYGDTYLAAKSVVHVWEKGREIAEGFSLASWVLGMVS